MYEENSLTRSELKSKERKALERLAFERKLTKVGRITNGVLAAFMLAYAIGFFAVGNWYVAFLCALVFISAMDSFFARGLAIRMINDFSSFLREKEHDELFNIYGGTVNAIKALMSNNKSKSENKGNDRRKTICVIDDAVFVRESVKREFPDYFVTEMRRLPDDKSELAVFDILIIDNHGIGNGRYLNGLAFLRDYEMVGNNKCVIFHSGNEPYGEDADMLANKGFQTVTKGRGIHTLHAVVDCV